MAAIIDYRGKTPTKTTSGIPLITAKIVKNGRIDEPSEFIDPADYDLWMTRGLPEPGDIVLTTEAPLGEVAQLDGRKVALAQRIITLRGKSGTLDNNYLKYVLQSDSVKSQLFGRASGSTVSGIKQSELRKVELPLPPINEQEVIGSTLGALDDKIDLNRRMNETLEQTARALFKDWFVDFGPTKAKMVGQATYLEANLWDLFPERLDEAGVPEGWHIGELQELIELNPTEKLVKNETAPYLDMAALPTSGSIPEQPILRGFTSGTRFRNGDTLFARITPCLENGKTAFVQTLPDGSVGWGSTEFIVLRAKSPVPAAYTYLLARSEAFREHAIQSMTGTSGRQRARNEALSPYLSAIPDSSVWKAFANIVEPLFRNIKANGEESRTLAQTRDLLLPKLMSGELHVRDAEMLIQEVV